MPRQITIKAPEDGKAAVVLMEGDNFGIVYVNPKFFDDLDAWQQALDMAREQIEEGANLVATWKPPADE